MIASYLPKPLTKQNVLRRGELKAVYDNIVNLSKSSPFYKINLSKENQLYTLGIKDTANELKSIAKELADSEHNLIFKQRILTVSDAEVLTANLLKDETEHLPEAISLTVGTLAASQQNRGKELFSTSLGIERGNYKFEVTVKDQIYDFKYTVEERIKNLQAQRKLADFINEADMGITASVERNDDEKYSHIIIESDLRVDQDERIFSIKDLDGINVGLVDYFGIDHMDRGATNTRFELNGVQKQTSSNVFTLEDTIQVSLNKTSEKPVVIKLVPDSDKILEEVNFVFDTYNGMINLARARKETTPEHNGATKLITDFKGIAHLYQEEMEACGLNITEDGTIKVDEVLAFQAATDGGMESLFKRENGFITRLIEKAEAVVINPMEYLDKIVVTYPNNTKTNYANPYVTSMYSGMLFNSYC